jgi:hypothetical protein
MYLLRGYLVKRSKVVIMLDHGCSSASPVIVWTSKSSFLLNAFACRRSTDNTVSIFLVASSLVVLLLVFESVKLVRRRSGVGLWFVIGWLGLSFVWLRFEDFG